METLNRVYLALVPFILCSCATSSITVEQISAQVERQGAKSYLMETFDNHEQWFAHTKALQQGLDNGDDAALNVVSKIKAVSDAGASVSLNFMVARAIPKNSNIVSSSVKSGFELSGICNVPYIEEEQEVVDEYIKNAQASLKKEMELGDVMAGECLEILESRITSASKMTPGGAF